MGGRAGAVPRAGRRLDADWHEWLFFGETTLEKLGIKIAAVLASPVPSRIDGRLTPTPVIDIFTVAAKRAASADGVFS